MTTFYRHGSREGQPVTLEGLLGTCERCSAPAIRHVWDRKECTPQRNWLGRWCRIFSPVEPPHRFCQRHLRWDRVELLFANEVEWLEAQAEQTGEEWEQRS